MTVVELTAHRQFSLPLLPCSVRRAQAGPMPTNVAAMKSMVDQSTTEVRWVGGWRGGGFGYRGVGFRGTADGGWIAGG